MSERSKFHGLLNDAQAVLGEFYFSDYVPCLWWIDRLRGLLWRLDKTFKNLDLFYQQVIDDHMDPATRRQTDQEDIIDIFLQMMDDRSTSFDLSLDHIKAMLMVTSHCLFQTSITKIKTRLNIVLNP